MLRRSESLLLVVALTVALTTATAAASEEAQPPASLVEFATAVRGEVMAGNASAVLARIVPGGLSCVDQNVPREKVAGEFAARSGIVYGKLLDSDEYRRRWKDPSLGLGPAPKELMSFREFFGRYPKAKLRTWWGGKKGAFWWERAPSVIDLLQPVFEVVYDDARGSFMIYSVGCWAG